MPDQKLNRLEALDELRWGLIALRAVRDLMSEAARNEERGYECVSPLGLAELIDMLETRIARAASALGAL